MAGSIHFPEELRPELAETLDRSRDLLQKRGRLLEESRTIERSRQIIERSYKLIAKAKPGPLGPSGSVLAVSITKLEPSPTSSALVR
jgi:hypothetical protein